jgi:hypothetical protein
MAWQTALPSQITAIYSAKIVSQSMCAKNAKGTPATYAPSVSQWAAVQVAISKSHELVVGAPFAAVAGAYHLTGINPTGVVPSVANAFSNFINRQPAA